MKNNTTVVVVWALMLAAIVAIYWIGEIRPTEQYSSFVGYSRSCWQEGNVLHVVTAKGDTVRLDLSRMEGAK